ncbi:MAG: hypothetical protein ACD_15C00114G0007 [uncultured bacterium]|nr:MAG: hypothetical protein ACD_15C00114G0007 [uncultured bacterium]HCU70456.1 hypothetical protein [Candidatus Moranbacteria bacterium]
MNIFYPIEIFADWATNSIFQISLETRLAEVVSYFIFDTIKILILLSTIIFAVSIIRSFLPPEKIRDILSHKNKYIGNLLASLLGIITPFCSCSAVPLFLGFVQAGVPLGATFSFLVASPMINEVALVLLWGVFGWKIAALYVASGLLIAISSGIVIEKMNVKNLLEDFVFAGNGKNVDLPQPQWNERIGYAKKYTRDIIKKVWIYVVIGVAVGAWIHGYVPEDFLAQHAGGDRWYGVPLAVLIGIPLYSNAAGVIPLVGALSEKGVAMGTTIAFMMAVTALSFPEFLILKRVMKIKLIAIFALIVATGIVFTGYLLNFIL